MLLLLLLLVPEHALPLLFLLLAWLAQFGLRQHLQTRDFLPDGVRALNSVEVGLGSGASVFVVVVVVVKIGCRQQDEEDTDVVSVTVAADSASTVLAFDVAADAAGDADVTVFVDSAKQRREKEKSYYAVSTSGNRKAADGSLPMIRRRKEISQGSTPSSRFSSDTKQSPLHVTGLVHLAVTF